MGVLFCPIGRDACAWTLLLLLWGGFFLVPVSFVARPGRGLPATRTEASNERGLGLASTEAASVDVPVVGGRTPLAVSTGLGCGVACEVVHVAAHNEAGNPHLLARVHIAL